MSKSDDPQGPRRIDITSPDDEPTAADPEPEAPDALPEECQIDGGETTAAAQAGAETVTSEAEMAKLQEMLAEVEKRCAYAEDQHVRLAAELQNYRRRVQQEKEQLSLFANERILQSLIPILDNFERAMQVQADSPGAESLLMGVTMICDQLLRTLESHGVERFDALGQTFDPNLHEAVGSEESTTVPPDVVIDELAKGYKLGGRVVRPARVRVSAKPVEG